MAACGTYSSVMNLTNVARAGATLSVMAFSPSATKAARVASGMLAGRLRSGANSGSSASGVAAARWARSCTAWAVGMAWTKPAFTPRRALSILAAYQPGMPFSRPIQRRASASVFSFVPLARYSIITSKPPSLLNGIRDSS